MYRVGIKTCMFYVLFNDYDLFLILRRHSKSIICTKVARRVVYLRQRLTFRRENAVNQMVKYRRLDSSRTSEPRVDLAWVHPFLLPAQTRSQTTLWTVSHFFAMRLIILSLVAILLHNGSTNEKRSRPKRWINFPKGSSLQVIPSR